MIWDTHAHLDDKRFDSDREQVIRRARDAGVTNIINIGYDLPSSKRAVDMAMKYDFMYAAVGIHPHNAKECTEEVLSKLERLVQNPKVIAWGEIGLDYYRDLSPRDVQRQVFVKQIELANAAGLPIIIHNRDAHGDLLQVIKKHRPEYGGLFHSYSGSWEMAKELLKEDYYLSFSGPLTYKNARHSVEVATKIPEDRFVVETDCPYLTPEPYRGQRNEPAYVCEVVKKIAELKGLSYEKVAELSTRNAEEFFKIND
jgi:TatD DNase family protein